MLGMWAERAGAEVAVTEKGWGCEALQPPQLVRSVMILTFAFLWFVLLPPAMHTPAACCDFICVSLMRFVVCLVWLVIIFSGITRDEAAACEVWAV